MNWLKKLFKTSNEVHQYSERESQLLNGTKQLINVLEKSIENNDLEIINLNYAKLLESYKQLTEINSSKYLNVFKKCQAAYESFKDESGYETPEIFKPYTERDHEKLTKQNDEHLINLHYEYSSLITNNYKFRNDVKIYNKIVEACYKMIEMAPAVKKAFLKDGFCDQHGLYSHEGFERLVVIRTKEKKYNEALELSLKAKKQGWQGDWDNRIEKLKKKITD